MSRIEVAEREITDLKSDLQKAERDIRILKAMARKSHSGLNDEVFFYDKEMNVKEGTICWSDVYEEDKMDTYSIYCDDEFESSGDINRLMIANSKEELEEALTKKLCKKEKE